MPSPNPPKPPPRPPGNVGSSFQSTTSIDDDVVASNALSFGGIASSSVVGRVHDSFSKEKGPPPLPSPGIMDRSGRSGETTQSGQSKWETWGGTPGSGTLGSTPASAGSSAGSGQESTADATSRGTTKGPPPAPPYARSTRSRRNLRGPAGNTQTNNDMLLTGAAAYLGESKMSMMGSDLQAQKLKHSVLNDDDGEGWSMGLDRAQTRDVAGLEHDLAGMDDSFKEGGDERGTESKGGRYAKTESVLKEETEETAALTNLRNVGRSENAKGRKAPPPPPKLRSSTNSTGSDEIRARLKRTLNASVTSDSAARRSGSGGSAKAVKRSGSGGSSKAPPPPPPPPSDGRRPKRDSLQQLRGSLLGDDDAGGLSMSLVRTDSAGAVELRQSLLEDDGDHDNSDGSGDDSVDERQTDPRTVDDFMGAMAGYGRRGRETMDAAAMQKMMRGLNATNDDAEGPTANPPPPSAAHLAKKWTPASKKRGSAQDDDAPQDDAAAVAREESILDDVLGYATKRESELVSDSDHGLSSSSLGLHRGDHLGGMKSPKLGERQLSASMHSIGEHDPSLVESPKRSPVQKKKLAVEKLSAVQATLERKEGKGKDALRDSIKMLQSSIRDLREAAGEEFDEDDENDDDDTGSFDYGRDRKRLSQSTGQHSARSARSKGSKSSSHRRRRRASLDDKSTGGRSRKSKSKGGKSKRSKGSSGASRASWEGGSKAGESRRSAAAHASAPIPAGAKRALARCRGGEALPREGVVSDVVRPLLSRMGREAGAAQEEGDATPGGPCCVVVMSPPSTEPEQGLSDGGAGTGKTTIVALACVRGDVRTRYRQGIAWLDRDHKPLGLDFEAYSKALSDICRQIGVKPQQLKLSPVVRSPGEDAAVVDVRMRDHMTEARGRMGKLLTSLQRRRRTSKKDRSTTVLVVLDDVAAASDVAWFQFRRGGDADGAPINDLLVTSRTANIPGALALIVPPLETKEGVRLLLTEADLPGSHPLAKGRDARRLVKDCGLHPLAIKFAGRWLGLKRATSGGQKGIDEVLGEVHGAIKEGKAGDGGAVDALYFLLRRAMSPLVQGKATKIIRLCFAALVTVFYDAATSTSDAVSIPLELANDFFLKVVENERDTLKKEDAFFQHNGRQASKLVPEILGALGVFNITRHTTQAEGSEKNESSIQIDHDLVRQFSRYIVSEDEDMRSLVRDSERRWNEAFVQCYFQKKALNMLWDDIQPDRSRRHALERMPGHMIRGEMFDDLDALMCNASFIRGRFWSLGWTEGTRAHVSDAEAFCNQLLAKGEAGDGSSKIVEVCKQLEAVLMEEVARESGGPNGRCSTLEAGRCLHEISLSLSRFQIWEEASGYCDTCVELVESNLGPSDLVASLLYNSSVMHAEANHYEEAEKKIGDCLDMRVETCGTESIPYVRALCQLGSILSLSSDYSAAQSCFNKCIGILKVIPPRFPLDFGVALYKLGRNQHRRGGFLGEAMNCYHESLEFERAELGPQHVFISSILEHKGDLLLDNEDFDQATQSFEEALDVLRGVGTPSSFASTVELNIKVDICEGKLFSAKVQSDKSIEKYQGALKLLWKHAPSRKRKMAQINAFIGLECEKKGDYQAADQYYEESISEMKSAFGELHLDIAETLVNLSGVKSALGEVGGAGNHVEHHAQASRCLEEAIDIQKSRLGECEEVAITLTIFGAHLKTIGSYEKSESACNEALHILEASEGDHDLSLVDALLGLADLMAAVSKYDDAMKHYDKCLKVQERAFGKKHDDIASTLRTMGQVQLTAGSDDDALILFAKSLVMLVDLHGSEHSLVADTYDMLGFVEAKKGDLDAALHRLTEAVKVRKAVGDKLEEAATLVNVGNLFRERQEFDLAFERYDEALDIRLSKLGKNHQSVADVYMAIGNVQSDMNRPEDALASYREALQILLSTKANGESVASLFVTVGMIQFRAGNLESALGYLNQAIESYRQVGGERLASNMVTPLVLIGNIHRMLEQKEEAGRVYEEALELHTTLGEKAMPGVHQVLTQLTA